MCDLRLIHFVGNGQDDGTRLPRMLLSFAGIDFDDLEVTKEEWTFLEQCKRGKVLKLSRNLRNFLLPTLL